MGKSSSQEIVFQKKKVKSYHPNRHRQAPGWYLSFSFCYFCPVAVWSCWMHGRADHPIGHCDGWESDPEQYHGNPCSVSDVRVTFDIFPLLFITYFCHILAVQFRLTGKTGERKIRKHWKTNTCVGNRITPWKRLIIWLSLKSTWRWVSETFFDGGRVPHQWWLFDCRFNHFCSGDNFPAGRIESQPIVLHSVTALLGPILMNLVWVQSVRKGAENVAIFNHVNWWEL